MKSSENIILKNPFHFSSLQQAKTLPKNRTLNETEWRGIGVQQSRGWEHYACHRPEPHILLFRRPLGTDPLTGACQLNHAFESYLTFPSFHISFYFILGDVDADLEREAKEQYQRELCANQRK